MKKTVEVRVCFFAYAEIGSFKGQLNSRLWSLLSYLIFQLLCACFASGPAVEICQVRIFSMVDSPLGIQFEEQFPEKFQEEFYTLQHYF